jgi:hypothetical protein
MYQSSEYDEEGNLLTPNVYDDHVATQPEESRARVGVTAR